MDAETVSLISDIVVGVSALGVAVIAFFGLQTWRRELTGKAKFALARDLILTGLKLKAHFEWARGLLTLSGESADRPRQESEAPGVSQVLDEWFARANRLKPLQEDLIKIQEASWEAQILLSKDSSKSVSEAVKVYRSKFAELLTAISSYFYARRQEVETGQPHKDRKELDKLHKTIYGELADDFSKQVDDFSKQIEKATTKLKSALQAYVK
jgi:hypothetical protein